jgi:hypothetical protein
VIFKTLENNGFVLYAVQMLSIKLESLRFLARLPIAAHRAPFIAPLLVTSAVGSLLLASAPLQE